MTKDDSDILLQVVEAIAERIRNVEARVATLESAQPAPLEWPAIDLGLVEGSK